MSRNRMDEHNIRKLTKVASGSSYGITLPIEHIRELKWKEHQKLVVEKRGKTLVIRDWEK